ncbi:gas vesicle protein [Streptantibioticus rubrisoli]|uniref:Gas vesicle protein n=1 Tax=Streptantibioticus rubrisoli TaxID=1387313 RepID=A0ABT1PFU2_9ACTN|nr:gas vesicle protein [Streptantibioticus rubrisoli]MCQ4044241.1 gas vesicle protein [Streptantibioticus rubrisoli]
MTQYEPAPRSSRALSPYEQGSGANLADILERVLDKGIVIVGDIKINLLDIELLTIKLRLLVASVDKAREIGIDWWEHDPALSSRADRGRTLQEQNDELRAELEVLRRQVRESQPELSEAGSGSRHRSRDADDADGADERQRETRAEPRRKRRRVEDDEDDEDRS